MPQVQVLEGIPSFGGELGRALGSGLGQGLSTNLQNWLQQRENTRKTDLLEQEFIRKGYPKELASLAAVGTIGGQTEVLKHVLEGLERGNIGEQRQVQPVEEKEEKIDQGLTTKEKVKRGEARYKTNLPLYTEAGNKLGALEQEGMKLGRLTELNETDQLPQGLGRINVNLSTGELRAPFLASPEAQEFTKIVNDFLTGAKDTFGARVTNFEIDRFMKRLPSLLNTKEGRNSVLKQMQIINEINGLHNQALLETYDKHGGIRGIDQDQAERLARSAIKPQIDQLKKEFVSGQRFSSKQAKPKSEKTVLMVDSEGNEYDIPRDKAKSAVEKGLKLAK